MSKRGVERLKTLLIVALSISALLLLLCIQPFYKGDGTVGGALKSIWSSVSGGSAYTDGAASTDDLTSGACLPLRMAWTTAAGRCALQYGQGDLSSSYEAIATLLGEALGSASEPEQMAESLWREKLGQSGVYLDYAGLVPAQVLASWVGAQAAGSFFEKNIRRLVLAHGEDGTELCFTDSENYYRCSTEVNFAAVEQALSQLSPTGAAFAFELSGEYANVAPYTLISGSVPEAYQLTSLSPLQSSEQQDALMKALGFNPNSTARYLESDGTNGVVESSGVLRFTAGGYVQYRGSDGETGALTVPGDGSLAQTVAYARRLLSECADLSAGEQQVYLISAESENNTTTVCFGYAVAGIPVQLGEGKCALKMQTENGSVKTLELELRVLTRTGDSVTLLPESLAAAAVQSGGELTLNYNEELMPIWVAD